MWQEKKRASKPEMPLSFLQVWKALIISPQLRSQPLVTGSEIMNGFYRMLVICASCSQKPGDLDWLRGHYELSPLSPIFPKLKTYRPAWLKDVKQMLFADICIPKIFFLSPRNVDSVNIEFYSCYFHKSEHAMAT